jgi:hypothetical protein
MRHPSVTGAAVFLLLLLTACQRGNTVKPPPSSTSSTADDSAFAAVQRRGGVAMGVDQYTSTHTFEPLPDGGRITLRRDAVDPAGVAQIRTHMTEIAAAFRRGDFNLPGFVHDRPVPGTAIMAARQSHISYVADTVPQGGSLRIHSADSVAVSAIHQFLAFQRRDHRSSHAGSH